MKKYLSITEMAKLRNITTETLRYYDRIGLLKPDYLNENNVRYYSVLKYEQLETIKELQQIGLNLTEIRHYLSDRTIHSSEELLLRQNTYCEEKIQLYQALQEKIRWKLTTLSAIRQEKPVLMQPQIVSLPERICYCAEHTIQDEISLSYECMELEHLIKDTDPLIPIYASDCYAGLFSLHSNNLQETHLLFFLASAAEKGISKALELPAGDYVCVYTNTSFWDRVAICDCIAAFARANALALDDRAVVISKIDYSITDIPEERLYEFQVRICD